MKTGKNIQRVFLSCIVALAGVSTSFAHDTGVPHREISNDLSTVLPWTHLLKGDWLNGIVFLVMWIVIIRGIYVLILLALSRALPRKDKTRKE